MEHVHEEKYNGLIIKISYDDQAQSPQEWENDGRVFLVGYHRDFWVDVPACVKGEFTKDELGAHLQNEVENNTAQEFLSKYHIFPLEAYIHSGVVLALRNEGNFPDRRWDVSYLGAVLIAKTEARSRVKARKIALGLIETWNDYLAGRVYGLQIENDQAQVIDSCWGFYGDYDAKDGALSEARAIIDSMTNNGTTDEYGQQLMGFARVK